MISNKPLKPAKEFNMKTIKKGQDKKTEYIVAKKSNGIKYWKILKKEEKKCLKEFDKKKTINLAEYKKGRYSTNLQAIAVTYSQVFKNNPKCNKYIGRNKKLIKKSINKSTKKSTIKKSAKKTKKK